MKWQDVSNHYEEAVKQASPPSQDRMREALVNLRAEIQTMREQEGWPDNSIEYKYPWRVFPRLIEHIDAALSQEAPTDGWVTVSEQSPLPDDLKADDEIWVEYAAKVGDTLFQDCDQQNLITKYRRSGEGMGEKPICKLCGKPEHWRCEDGVLWYEDTKLPMPPCPNLRPSPPDDGDVSRKKGS